MKALLLVDIQNDYFQNGAFPLPKMEQTAKKAAEVLAWARRTGQKVVHIRHEEADPAAGFLVRGTAGAETSSLVQPNSGETVVTKNYPNSFVETDLASALAGIGELIIVGAMSNMCIDATARAAFDLGFEVTVVEDACAASDLEFQGKTFAATDVHGTFMAALASAYGKVVQAEDVISNSLEKPKSA